VTVAHSSPPFALENVASCVQALHWRSAVAEPAADLPWPAGHVAQAVHDDCPAELVNVPEVHAAHTRSDDVVAAFFV